MSAAIQLMLGASATSSTGIIYVSQGAAGTGSNPTVALPTTHASGDLLVIVAASNNAITAPAGWSTGVNNAAGARLSIFYKVDGGAESNVSLTASGSATQAIMLSYRNTNATPLDVAGTTNTGTSTTITTTSLTTLTNAAIVISAFVSNSNAATFTLPVTGCTTRYDGGGIASIRPILIVDEIKATTGATTARSVTQSTSSNWQAHGIAFKP